VLELGYRPKFIYVEHAYNFPPGFWFQVRYSKQHPFWWWSSRDHVFGNSASVWYELLVGTGEYVLLGVSGNNMLFGHVSVVKLPSFMANSKKAAKVAGGWQPSLQCAFEEGFLNASVWYGKAALNTRGVSWWTHDEISPDKRLYGMMDHVRHSPTMKKAGLELRKRWNGTVPVHLYTRMPAPGGPPAAIASAFSLPYPVELRLDENPLPLHGACGIDSCARERVVLKASA